MALVSAGALSRNAVFIECAKLVTVNGKSLLRPQGRLFAVPTATIVSKIYQDESFQRKKPWPYKEKGYNYWHYLYEKTLPRFNENTKILVVEGPIASGKTTLAKQIAEELDMAYFPEPTADMFYTNEYGFNQRSLNPQLPPNARFTNLEDLYTNPTKRNATYHQTKLYQMNFVMYLDAFAHILNTGQGVVMDRCMYSNMVNMESLVAGGYIRPEYRKWFYDCFFIIKRFVMRPHLVIYLDVPVNVVQERIKKRGLSYELNSPLLTTKYLADNEKYFKEKFLPEISVHAELLVYDWSHFGDAEVVIEDIELIDFDKYGEYDSRMSDWRLDREKVWGMYRMTVTTDRVRLLNLFCQSHTNIPEMWMSGDDYLALREVALKQPTLRYAQGYNAAAGDKNILWKNKFFGWRYSGGVGI